MLKRFWPVLTLVIIIILAAIMLPVISGLMPKVATSDSDTQLFFTKMVVNFPFTEFPGNVKAGDSFELSGHLYYIGYISPDGSLSSFPVNQEGNIYYKLSDHIYYVKIIPDGSITEVTLDNPDDFMSNSIQAVLKPLSYQNVKVMVAGPFGSYFTQEVTTDYNGYFQTTVHVDLTPDKQSAVGAAFLGSSKLQNFYGTKRKPLSTVYIWSDDWMPKEQHVFKIPGENSGFGSVTAITAASAGFSFIFLLIIGYFLFRYRKQLRAWLKKRKAKVRQIAPSLIEETIPTQTEATWEGDSRIEIVFPQIENPLPPVWGIGEPLAISSRVKADKVPEGGMSVPQIRAAALALDLTVPGYMQLKVEHTFVNKGMATVSITFGSETADEISASRQIRIVDYREEIVALFNGLIDTLFAKGAAVNRSMTAREIENKLNNKYPSLVQADLAYIIRGFEFANYSLRPVARQVYVEMYMAIEKIREKIIDISPFP